MREPRQPRRAAGPAPPGAFVVAGGVPRALRARRRRQTGRSTSTEPKAPSTTSRCRSAPAWPSGTPWRWTGRAPASRPGRRGRELAAGPGDGAARCRGGAGHRAPDPLGHSFGAAVALGLGPRRPDDVAAVVTLGGYVLPLGGPPPWVVALMRRDHAARRGRGRPLPPRAPVGRSAVSARSLPATRRPRTHASRRSWRSRPPTSSATARTAGPRRRVWRPCAPVPHARGTAGDRRRRSGPHGPAGDLRAAARAGPRLGARARPRCRPHAAVHGAGRRGGRCDRAAELAGAASTFASPRRAGSLDNGRARRGASGALYPQSATAGLNSRPRGRSARLSAVSRR